MATVDDGLNGKSFRKNLIRCGRIIAFAIGCAAIVGGLIWMMRTAYFLKEALKTPGQVIAMPRTGGWRDTRYYPIFVFTNDAGVVLTQRSRINFEPEVFKPPQSVTVIYEPSKPDEARIETFRGLWLMPVLMIGWGLLCVLGAVPPRRKAS